MFDFSGILNLGMFRLNSRSGHILKTGSGSDYISENWIRIPSNLKTESDQNTLIRNPACNPGLLFLNVGFRASLYRLVLRIRAM